ncbi:hypothetical protein U2087_15740, partial [Listeria monocytogenes]
RGRQCGIFQAQSESRDRPAEDTATATSWDEEELPLQQSEGRSLRKLGRNLRERQRRRAQTFAGFRRAVRCPCFRQC